MQGSRTPAETEAEFRGAYIRLGNASAAAREVKIPVRTGQELLRRARLDPEFAKACADIYARRYEEAEDLIVDALHSAHEQITGGEGRFYRPEDIARVAVENDLKSLSYQDPRPQLLKAMADVGKVIFAARKQDDGAAAADGPAVVINIAGAIEAEPGPKSDA